MKKIIIFLVHTSLMKDESLFIGIKSLYRNVRRQYGHYGTSASHCAAQRMQNT